MDSIPDRRRTVPVRNCLVQNRGSGVSGQHFRHGSGRYPGAFRPGNRLCTQLPGTPYKLGAAGPSRFDCSSYTSYVFKHFGYDITAYSAIQFREGREVPNYRDLQKGDLVFFGKRGSVRNIGHVGIVVSIDHETGSFTFIHASVSKGVVEQSFNHPYFMMRYMGARRILPDE